MFGPSLFLFNYKPNNNERQTAFVPGASFTSRLPLGKEKRLFGIDLLLDASLAPPVKVDMKDTSPGAFKATKANMIHGSIGFACSFRRQAGK